MKNRKLRMAVLGLMVTASACTKQLTQIPDTSKVLSNFFTTESESEEYVNATYAALQSQGLYGQYQPCISEIPSDNTWDQVPANDNGWAGQLDLFSTIPSNGILSRNWQDAYVAIQRANVVLHRIDAITYQNDSIKTARVGAMEFIRALMYFNLVRTYGDVPLVTKETTDPNAYFGQGRTAAEEVYTQVIKDLQDAMVRLPLKADKAGGIRRSAAQALLGKVYLTRGRYQDAVAVLQDVVTSGQHSLMATTDKVFALNNENNAEIIFVVQYASGVNGATEGSALQQQFSPSGFESGAKGHNLPNLSLYRLYSSADTRKGIYVDTTKQGVPYCKKYVANPANLSDGGSDYVVLRYADVLLMLAEAHNELGNSAGALDNLNQVRKRAGLSNFENTSKQALDAEIALERQLELIGEGHRWFDLLRKGNAVQVMNDWFTAQSVNIRIDKHHLLMPVPQDQVNTDPAILQNEGY
ncbi:RagB/SusD family nutrient uptake outer membrane protein [Taibaiella chishuiensis]|uniref:RagB/SusD domain-containing protein n=1 Tax=Taibaiella chishuiensis TaxID=1434707 RepID=A0A2P8CX18_9BACT|nr:RagB/SusD family nutrient uptake outer membrane protein [Taibaiella chishuiensis]PSK89523.1 RagB/SusD domain-containing protein [Taibaiella chishuiensis]